MRYLGICAIWLACYYLPIQAGDWFDYNFHLYQSLVSIFLMFAVFKLSDEWWVKEFGALCVIQILHNFGDAFLASGRYNDIQAILNTLEVIIIFGAGGMTQLLRMYHGKAGGSNNPRNGSLSTAHSPQRGGKSV